jgi:hypothetical protein
MPGVQSRPDVFGRVGAAPPLGPRDGHTRRGDPDEPGNS